MDPEARIAELEAELDKARQELTRLRGLESENRQLRARVTDLHSELITLRPPKMPRVSGIDHAGPATPSQAVRARKSRLMTWTTLILVLAGAALASLPYLLNYLDAEHGDGGQFTNQRGLGSSAE